jgi:hypothetical protein
MVVIVRERMGDQEAEKLMKNDVGLGCKFHENF